MCVFYPFCLNLFPFVVHRMYNHVYSLVAVVEGGKKHVRQLRREYSETTPISLYGLTSPMTWGAWYCMFVISEPHRTQKYPTYNPVVSQPRTCKLMHNIHGHSSEIPRDPVCSVIETILFRQLQSKLRQGRPSV